MLHLLTWKKTIQDPNPTKGIVVTWQTSGVNRIPYTCQATMDVALDGKLSMTILAQVAHEAKQVFNRLVTEGNCVIQTTQYIGFTELADETERS